MNIRYKFHLILYLGIVFIYIIFFIGFEIFNKSVGTLIMALLFFIALWYCIEQIKCPHCDTKLILYYRPNSKYYTGFHCFLPEKCFCCGKKF